MKSNLLKFDREQQDLAKAAFAISKASKKGVGRAKTAKMALSEVKKIHDGVNSMLKRASSLGLGELSHPCLKLTMNLLRFIELIFADFIIARDNNADVIRENQKHVVVLKMACQALDSQNPEVKKVVEKHLSENPHRVHFVMT